MIRSHIVSTQEYGVVLIKSQYVVGEGYLGKGYLGEGYPISQMWVRSEC